MYDNEVIINDSNEFTFLCTVIAATLYSIYHH